MTHRGLSKSRVLDGSQCLKRVWLRVNRPELAQPRDDARTRLAAGTEFGELARALIGPGELVGQQADLSAALQETLNRVAAAEMGAALFEPAFRHEGVLVRVDALVREASGWTLTEVKSTTEVKGHHYVDIALQAWVVEGAGLALDRAQLGIVNNCFVYSGDGAYEGLLELSDVSSLVRPMMAEIPVLVGGIRAALDGSEPAIRTGKHCKTPSTCPFLAHCRSQESTDASFPVEILPRSSALAPKLAAAGYQDLRDVPLDRLDRPIDRRIAECSRTGEPFVGDGLRSELRAIPYPRFYLDFETIAPIVPRWEGTRPYQATPFQWSCHREEANGSLQHHEFLDLTGDDPSRRCAESLIDACGDRGPVLVYNIGTERGVVRELAQRHPDLAPRLVALVDRMVDLLPIFRKHYYHPAMMGSWSIKKVLPTVAPELDYGDLEEVAGGTAAQAAYVEAIGPETSDERRRALRKALLAYCKRDTEAMLRLVQAFV